MVFHYVYERTKDTETRDLHGFPHPELGVLPLLERAQQHAFGDHREPLNDIII